MILKIKYLLLLLVTLGSFDVFASTSFNVLTLNSWMLPFQGKLPMQRAKLIGQHISDYDLVFLEEAWTRDVRNEIKSNASDEFSDLYVYQIGNVLGNGLYNLSKFKIIKKAFMPFWACHKIQCAASKGVLYMQVRLPNGELIDAFSTHLQAYQKDSKVRVKQLRQTIKFINRMNGGIRPALFVGDFNIIASTDEYNHLENYLIGFQDVWLDYRPNDDGFTWNPYINSWAKVDVHETVQKQRIDYIFVRDGQDLKWSIIDTKIVFNHAFDSEAGSLFVSDHFGVSSTLELSRR